MSTPRKPGLDLDQNAGNTLSKETQDQAQAPSAQASDDPGDNGDNNVNAENPKGKKPKQDGSGEQSAIIELLAQQNALLSKQISLQESKIDALMSMVANSSSQQMMIHSTTKQGSVARKAMAGEANPTKADDRLESPRIFYCSRASFTLSSEKRNGQSVIVPRGAVIEFTPFSRAPVNGQDGKRRILSISIFKTYSREIAEFIESSNHYGLTIFDTARDVMENSSEQNQMVISQISRLNRMPKQQVDAMMKSSKIPEHYSDQQRRKTLAMKLAAQAMSEMFERSVKTLTVTTEADSHSMSGAKISANAEPLVNH